LIATEASERLRQWEKSCLDFSLTGKEIESKSSKSKGRLQVNQKAFSETIRRRSAVQLLGRAKPEGGF